MKIMPILFLLIAAMAAPVAAQADSRWNNAPYVSAPPVVTETPDELKSRVVEISTFPTDLDPRIWDGDKLREDVRQRTLEVIEYMFAELKLKNVTIQSVEVRGSNVSYEYDDAADFGVRVFLDTSAYKGSIEDLAARIKSYNAFIEVKHEGKVLLHGVPLEVNFYVIRSARLNPVKGVGHYSITEDKWMERPAVQESKFDRNQMLADMTGVTTTYNGLVTAYFADKQGFECSRWKDFSKSLGDYRNAGIDKSGTRSTENLVYRLLRRLKVNVVEQSSALALECQNIHWSLD
ncbi:MAG: hypothetical protein WCJ41_20765 [Aestuariivirga sp.]|uniref:hypothetical protein n=1 Tax=Aestuariivirga sp. TaxID=2650926 RepID=UPI003015E48F